MHQNTRKTLKNTDEELKDLHSIWETMNARKNALIERCEQYAVWTVPSVCPQEEESESEQTKGNVAIGARLVNHLANRIVDTMFPSDRPFFSLPLTPEAENKLSEELEEEEKNKYLRDIKKVTAAIEDTAMRKLNLTSYRPIAVQAVQHLIITGNAVIHRTEDDMRTVYGVKDSSVTRDVKGRLVNCMLRDSRMFGTLSTEMQERLTEDGKKEYKQEDPVTVYTYYYLDRTTKKWTRLQGIDTIVLMNTKKTYAKVDLPILSLTWNLSRGENYGRGLVEDHSVTFHNIDVTTLAMIDLINIAADVKFLVNPASTMDVVEWNEAERGAYLPGRPDDITTPQFPKRLEIDIMSSAIQRWEQELAQSFLLNSSGVRDAERVTAEEIRFVARELESAFGGLYSALALGWQHREATYLISKVNFSVEGPNGTKNFDVVVTTGLESLSREGQLDNLRAAIGDLQLMDAVPEDLRNVMDRRAFAEFVFTNRGMKIGQFILTQEQIEQQQRAAQQAQQAQQQAEGAQQVAVAAGQAASQEG